jgi:hypothetical protein
MNTSVDRTVIPLSHIGHSLCRPTIYIRPSLRPGAKKLHEPRPMPVRSGVSDQGTGPADETVNRYSDICDYFSNFNGTA